MGEDSVGYLLLDLVQRSPIAAASCPPVPGNVPRGVPVYRTVTSQQDPFDLRIDEILVLPVLLPERIDLLLDLPLEPRERAVDLCGNRTQLLSYSLRTEVV